MSILPAAPAPASAPASACAAHALTPLQRQRLATLALSGSLPVALLARQHQVSRKFVYRLMDRAQRVLCRAFAPRPARDPDVLFYLPVTRAWLRGLVLALVLVCRSSFRGVVELLRDLFDFRLSVGTVHGIVQAAVPPAREHNGSQDLSKSRIAALDEVFQAGKPVLVGCDAPSTYCFLLSQEENRDAQTWGLRLLEMKDKGFRPQATVADAGPALRAGQKAALPKVPCRGDVFHALAELGPLAHQLEARAYEAIAAHDKLRAKLARPGKRRDRGRMSWLQKRWRAEKAEEAAIALAEDVALLLRWLREDVLAVAGPPHAVRLALFDFVMEELRARERRCPERMAAARKYLENQRDDLLLFAAEMDRDLGRLAARHEVPAHLVREALAAEALPAGDERGRLEEGLARQLGGRYGPLRVAVSALRRGVVRASSVVENVNGRLRNYFTLRRHLGRDYLELLQFFLNHRRFMRSERAERAGRSPRELLEGKGHGHWLELLGHQPLKRAA
jgi:hypothetical protein